MVYARTEQASAVQTHYLKDQIAQAAKDRDASGDDSVIVFGTPSRLVD